MSKEMQPQEAGVQANPLMPGAEIMAGAEQSPLQSVQQDKGIDAGQSSNSSPMDSWPHAEKESVDTPTVVDESDPVEVDLVAKLEALLAKDVDLSASYKVALQNHQTTGRERRRMRAELRRLHTEEGGILLQIKLHLARKGRAGGWAEFLRQRKPKPLSRTTADRWIHWYLDSDKQQQTHAERAPEQLSENAPQDESGAFSCTDAQSLQVPSDPEVPGSSDPPSASGSKAFEDLQQLVVLLRKSQAARFKASAEFLVGKNGSENHHEAIYVAVVEAAATLGFVYPANAEGEADYGIEETDSRTETPAGGDKAA